MIPTLSTEPAKPKRRASRKVYALTPAQLARKRANDREAQRAIRARTREHIERLERELAVLKSNQGRDQTIRELLRRNEAIEGELIRLKEIMRAPMASSSSPAPGLTPPRQLSFPDKLSASTVCNGNLSTGSDVIPSPRGAPFPEDYSCVHDYNQQYIPLPNNCESLASTIPCTIASNISTPSPSGDYSAGYIQTSVPATALPSTNASSSSICAIYNKDFFKMEYSEVGHHCAIPQALRQPDMKYSEEISHVKYLEARIHVNNPPFHLGTPYSPLYPLHH
ncbi:hypothetical protein FOMA001_g18312 [Fusarium oxysporum f. sp. matthiolae]|nr:hypothetical protein FOMA001_g18312 [Fusarium oxysporum f. sp. matthiolae]